MIYGTENNDIYRELEFWGLYSYLNHLEYPHVGLVEFVNSLSTNEMQQVLNRKNYNATNDNEITARVIQSTDIWLDVAMYTLSNTTPQIEYDESSLLLLNEFRQFIHDRQLEMNYQEIFSTMNHTGMRAFYYVFGLTLTIDDIIGQDKIIQRIQFIEYLANIIIHPENEYFANIIYQDYCPSHYIERKQYAIANMHYDLVDYCNMIPDDEIMPIVRRIHLENLQTYNSMLHPSNEMVNSLNMP